MRKVIMVLVTALMLISNVEAVTNRLYFTEKNNRLYYDTDAFDEDKFMAHYDMVPGREYIDEMLIENKTKETYDLYLKLKVESEDELSDELIDNILMEVYLEDELIYAGNARGLDYQGDGVDLQESVLLGRYLPNKENKLIVKTKLSDSYTNTNNTSIGKITWEFYGRYGEEVTPILPETRDNISKYVIIISSASLMLILIIMVANNKKEKENEE